jgi:hypothetical protein
MSTIKTVMLGLAAVLAAPLLALAQQTSPTPPLGPEF